jgi:hypothetical protein
MRLPEFQICFIMPKDTIDPLAFREVLFLLRNSLRKLGYACEIKPNHLDPDKINIILGYNLMAFGEIHRTTTFIPWQLEHLPGTHWFNENTLSICKHAAAVWDFSDINIQHLAKHDVEARLLRLGYEQSMQTFSPESETDCDVLFYGAINDRREKLLNALHHAGATVKRITGLFGQDRDAHIARAKMVINIHYHESGIQEAVRISHLLNNGVMVVSESAEDDPFPGVDLVTADYDDLTDTCMNLLADEVKREAARDLATKQFAENCRMIDYLEPLAKEVVLEAMS